MPRLGCLNRRCQDPNSRIEATSVISTSSSFLFWTVSSFGETTFLPQRPADREEEFSHARRSLLHHFPG